MDLQHEYIDDGSSFIEITPLSLHPKHLTKFSIFGRYQLEHKGEDVRYRYRCLLFDNTSVSANKYHHILKVWKSVYVHKRQGKEFHDYLRDNLHFVLENEDIPLEERTRTLTKISNAVVKEAFNANFDSVNFGTHSYKKIEKLISKALTFISDIKSLNGLAQLIGHDYDTHTHSVKVGWLMATFINANQDLFPIKSQKDLSLLLTHSTAAGFLHDIGKIKIPLNILNKNGKLNNVEFVAIQAHTAYSLSLLFETELPKATMQSILYHHENYDGSGYPCGLKGKEIPFLANIVHIADVFDALTSRRPYKEPKTPFEALKIMSGSNPHVDVLLQLEKEAHHNAKKPLFALVRGIDNEEEKAAKEKKIVEEAEDKRVEARSKLRDLGMSHCFDQKMLIRFIKTLNKSESFNLAELITD